MAELTIKTDDIAAVLRKHLEGFTPSLAKQQVGRIIEVGDGIARISGLPECAVNELIEFEGGALGLALNLDEESIGAVVLGDFEHIEEARQTADAMRQDLMRRAEEEAAAVRQRAEDDIRASTDRALADLQARVATLSIELAEKVVERNLDHDTQMQLIENYINEVGAQRA